MGYRLRPFWSEILIGYVFHSGLALGKLFFRTNISKFAIVTLFKSSDTSENQFWLAAVIIVGSTKNSEVPRSLPGRKRGVEASSSFLQN